MIIPPNTRPLLPLEVIHKDDLFFLGDDWFSGTELAGQQFNAATHSEHRRPFGVTVLYWRPLNGDEILQRDDHFTAPLTHTFGVVLANTGLQQKRCNNKFFRAVCVDETRDPANQEPSAPTTSSTVDPYVAARKRDGCGDEPISKLGVPTPCTILVDIQWED